MDSVESLASKPEAELPEYRRPEIETVLTAADLAREVLYAGAPIPAR